MQQEIANFFKKIAIIFFIPYLSKSYAMKIFMIFLFFCEKSGNRTLFQHRGRGKIQGSE